MKLKINIKLRRKREVFFTENNQRVEIHSRDYNSFMKASKKFGFTKMEIEVYPEGVLFKCIRPNTNMHSRLIKNLI